MQNINETPYTKTLSGLSEGELLPETTLKEILKNPIQLIVIDKLGNPERSEFAAKMQSQMKNLQQQKPSTLDNLQYLIILTANLTLYFYYEEDDQEADYWEKMEAYYKQMELIAPDLTDQQRAQCKLVMATTYKIIKHYSAAIERFDEAINSFKKNINKNSSDIRDCFLSIMDLHIAQAHRYCLDNFPSDSIQAEYTKAIQAANDALLILKSEKIPLEKLYYYKGQTAYFLAKYLYHQEISPTECINLIDKSVRAFLVAFISTKPKNSQIKLYQRLTECYELLIELKTESSKENVSFNNNIKRKEGNYEELGSFLQSQKVAQTGEQILFDKKAIKNLLVSFTKQKAFPFSLTDKHAVPLSQQKLDAYKENFFHQILPSQKGSTG